MYRYASEGEICDADGVCVDAANDVVFSLTSEDGKFAVKGEAVETEVGGCTSQILLTHSSRILSEAKQTQFLVAPSATRQLKAPAFFNR